MTILSIQQPIEIFTAAAHHDVLAMITQIALLLFTARLFGELAQRVGQPAIFGELLAGILLGPSCLGKIFPASVGVIIPGNPVQGHLLGAISLIGAIFLLLITGMEIDMTLIRRYAKTVVGISLGGISLSFCAGLLLGFLLPDTLLVAPHKRFLFSLFIAVAISIASIPVIAKVLMDLNLLRRNIGQTIIAAGMTDDAIGWILLSVIIGLATGKSLSMTSVLVAAALVVGFIAASFTLGKVIVKKSLDFVQDKGKSPDRLLTYIVVLTFAWGAMAQVVGIEPVLGALLVGILLGQMPRLPVSVHEKLESITFGIFAPIFFAAAGLKADVIHLLESPLWSIALLMILVASAGKIIGVYLGARMIGKLDIGASLSLGVGLNAQGAMGIIVATIGLTLNILTPEIFSMLVLLSIVTSLMAPFMLRLTFKLIRPDEEEIKRLQGESIAKNSSLGRLHRILVPLRSHNSTGNHNAINRIKATILNAISIKSSLSLTLLSVDSGKSKKDSNQFLNEQAVLFPQKELIKRVVKNAVVSDAILDEAQKDYDILVLGASETTDKSTHLFSETIDSIISLSPCLSMIVYTNNFPENWQPRRILVPTNGSFAAKRAAELAFLLAGNPDQVIHILYVIEKNRGDWQADVDDQMFKRQFEIAERMVGDLKEQADLVKVTAFTHVQIGTEPEAVILELAKRQNVDLIILGTDVRPASSRLFLGPRVEAILKDAPSPVIVLNSGLV